MHLLFFLFPLTFGGRLTFEENKKLQETCGQIASQLTERISMNTPNATRFEAPWAVQFLYDQTNKSAIENSQAFCSGTLISSRHIITSAHCVVNSEQFQLFSNSCTQFESSKFDFISFQHVLVVFSTFCQKNSNGITTCDSGKAYSRIKKAYADRNYSNIDCATAKERGDIALLELEEDVIFSDIIQPACYNTELPEANSTLTLFGYGNDNDNAGEGSGILRKYTARMSEDICKAIAPSKRGVICTQDEIAMACMGDSGSGQMFYKNGTAYLTGVLSSGPSCNPRMIPERMLDLSESAIHHQHWICSASGVCPTFYIPGKYRESYEKFYYES